MESNGFRVNKKRNYNQPQKVPLIKRKTPTAPPLSPTAYRKMDNFSNSVVTQNIIVKGKETLYPTLSSCYRREHLDYSPKEPTADYPYTDDLPINNIYPNLKNLRPGRETTESVLSESDNCTVNQLNSPNSLNPNIDIGVNKILYDKCLNVSPVFYDEEVEIDYHDNFPVNVDKVNGKTTHGTDYAKQFNSYENDNSATPIEDESRCYKWTQPPRNSEEFNSWMTWRKQVNRHMASMILIKQGKEVYLTPSEVNRKALPKATMQSVFDKARIDESKTSLPGKPYIMYGIPRVKLSE